MTDATMGDDAMTPAERRIARAVIAELRGRAVGGAVSGHLRGAERYERDCEPTCRRAVRGLLRRISDIRTEIDNADEHAEALPGFVREE
jgi:hypothetical protein